MKKTVISAIAALAIGTTGLSATQFYVDEEGQVFTTKGEGRKALETKESSIFAKADKLEFSGTHYLGFISKNEKNDDTTNNFEMRRNYVQVKAYVLDDPKSYLRVTLDATYTNSTADGEGHSDVYVKYAYLFLNEVIPFTGVEFGMAHRPWIDYEEHQGWWMRSISKVFVEASESSHLTNSADLGVNLKTKTPYFTSEVGLFNGEGYHGSNDNGGANDEEIGDGISVEWRATAALLGNGKKKRKPLKDDYFDVSFFGQHNMQNSKNADGITGNLEDYTWYGFHTVYNTPALLLSAQYVKSENDLKTSSEWNGDGFSVNGTLRFGEKKQYSIIGRYDNWTAEKDSTNEEFETNNAIYGVAWQQNKNIKWLLSGQTYDAKDNKNYKGSAANDWNSVMLTAEVHW
ncbi:MAG: hypothetical protein WCY51_06920 [Sulfurimonas sp.]